MIGSAELLILLIIVIIVVIIALAVKNEAKPHKKEKIQHVKGGYFMAETDELKNRLQKTTKLLEKLDERLAVGEINESQYKQLYEKYRAEADNLKNQITEKSLLSEVGLEDEETHENRTIRKTTVGRGIPTLTEMEKAGFWRRFGAYFVDGIIVNVMQMVLWLVLLPRVNPIDLLFNFVRVIERFFWIWLIITIIGYAYYVYFWGSSGQTPGKKLMGVRVIRTNGERVGFLRAFIRVTIGYFISAIILLIGFLWIGVDKNKQGFHDKITGTYVIRV